MAGILPMRGSERKVFDMVLIDRALAQIASQEVKLTPSGLGRQGFVRDLAIVGR